MFPRAAALAACLLCLAGPAPAQDEPRLAVSLEAPEAVRPLLERHVRLLRAEQPVPQRIADRIALIRRARRDIAGLLATEGHFSPVIDFERESAERWRILVDPGPRASVTAVDIAFEGHLGEPGSADRQARLREHWTLPAGRPFRQADWDEAKQNLLYAVSARDYASARITASRAEVDPDSASVRLSVTVDSGPPFRIGALEVRGIERLPGDFVERHYTLQPGEPFDQERLLELQSTLQNLPQFASVSVDVPRDRAQADAVPVRVQVSEAESRRLALGAGYSTNTGMRAEVGWRDVNLLSRGWELSTGLRLEEKRQSLFADIFLPPTRDNVRDSFGAMVEATDIEGLRTDRHAIGAVRTWTFDTDETALSLRYQRERLRPDGGEKARNTALTASVSWTRRAVDDVFDPGGGIGVGAAEQGGQGDGEGGNQRLEVVDHGGCSGVLHVWCGSKVIHLISRRNWDLLRGRCCSTLIQEAASPRPIQSTRRANRRRLKSKGIFRGVRVRGGTADVRRGGGDCPLPGQGAAFAVEESAVVDGLERGKTVEQGAGGLGRGQRGLLAAHVGPDPAGMESGHHDAARGQGMGQLHGCHVQCGFADGVTGGAEFTPPGQRTDFRGNIGHHRTPPVAAAVGQQGGQHLGQQEGADGIGAQAGFQVFLADLAKALARLQHAGIVEQQVQPHRLEHQWQLMPQLLAAACAGHVQRQHVQASGELCAEPVERTGAGRVAAGGHHPVARLKQLPGELQAQAAVGPGHQALPEQVWRWRHGRHPRMACGLV